MARKLRIEYAGACYHVINRGNYRRDLFGGEGAAESFQKCLFETVGRFGWQLHAFVIMRNHFHLAVETPEPNLSDGMRWLQATWAARFNRFHGETGRPFQGRYKALHVEPGHSLTQVARYIHLNPVRARIVTVETLLKFRWSSLAKFAVKKRPGGLTAGTILRECGGLPDTAAGWRSYRDYLGVLAGEDEKRGNERYGRLSRGWMIGSAEFKADLRRELIERHSVMARFELLGSDRAAQLEARSELWEEKLQMAATALGLALHRLPASKSAPPKVRLAALMKRVTSVSNGWLAKRLRMGQAGSVSQYVHRFLTSGLADSREFARALSRFTP